MSNKSKSVLSKIVIFVLIVGLVLLYSLTVNNDNSNNEQKLYDEIVIDYKKLNIFYFYVGQADCTLVQLGDDNMLIDTGNEEDAEYLLKFLKEKNITHIKYLIGTHIHEDHIGGMDIIISDEDITVDNIFIPKTEYGINKEYDEVKNIAEKRNYNIDIVNKNDIKEFNNAKIKIMSVDNNSPKDLNDSSIVLQLDYMETKYLFMGDSSSKIEKAIKNLETVDVLKVGHHGANKSTSEDFLEVINPKYAIISSGKNDDNHLGAETLERLEKIGIKNENKNLYITEEIGTIWLQSDGESITIEETWDINLDSADNKKK